MISRRDILRRAAGIGGYAAAFLTLQGLGFLATSSARAAPELPPGLGAGRRVIVLGAGVAGLVTAYRLERAGFDVLLLEARDRVGGRSWTVRDGTRIELAGESDQVARLSDRLYFNAGPARIPSHHQGLLGYARELGVPLEVEVNSSRTGRLQSDQAFGGRPIEQRQAVNDLRGGLSELLAKATNRGALDQELTATDKERLVSFLRSYGDLAPDLAYRGSERAGYLTAPGAADQTSVARAPLGLRDLLGDRALPNILFEDNIVMQATMLEPVGGMDRIPYAIAKALRRPPRLGAQVVSIRQSRSGVAVAWRDRASRAETVEHADYTVVTLPLNILAKIPTDLPAPVRAAVAGAVYDHAAKVAFDAPRFWEAEQIYGGLSFPDGGTGVVWYPSSGFHAPRGLLIGAYVAGPPAAAFEARSLAEQTALARAAVERLHPGHGAELSNPIVVDWSKAPFNYGPWLHWDADGNDVAAYRLLNQPQGRIFLSGAHLSQLPSWQEGAVAAAHRTVGLIADRTRADSLTR
jgi:monoamine oxidase